MLITLIRSASSAMSGPAPNRYRDDPTGQLTSIPKPGEEPAEQSQKEEEDIMEMDEEKFEKTARLCSSKCKGMRVKFPKHQARRY